MALKDIQNSFAVYTKPLLGMWTGKMALVTKPALALVWKEMMYEANSITNVSSKVSVFCMGSSYMCSTLI